MTTPKQKRIRGKDEAPGKGDSEFSAALLDRTLTPPKPTRNLSGGGGDRSGPNDDQRRLFAVSIATGREAGGTLPARFVPIFSSGLSLIKGWVHGTLAAHFASLHVLPTAFRA
jgi:hypothetical protein